MNFVAIYGESCSFRRCASAVSNLNCSGHGECNSTSGLCRCDVGWTSAASGCRSPECVPACGIHGSCQPGVSECMCAAPYTSDPTALDEAGAPVNCAGCNCIRCPSALPGVDCSGTLNAHVQVYAVVVVMFVVCCCVLDVDVGGHLLFRLLCVCVCVFVCV